MFKVNNKNTRTTSPFPNISVIDFEQVNASWVFSNNKTFITENEHVLILFNIHVYSKTVK